jgi:hypothetical protein
VGEFSPQFGREEAELGLASRRHHWSNHWETLDTLSIVDLPWPAQFGPVILDGHSVQRGGRCDNYSRPRRVRSNTVAATMAEFRMYIGR